MGTGESRTFLFLGTVLTTALLFVKNSCHISGSWREKKEKEKNVEGAQFLISLARMSGHEATALSKGSIGCTDE